MSANLASISVQCEFAVCQTCAINVMMMMTGDERFSSNDICSGYDVAVMVPLVRAWPKTGARTNTTKQLRERERERERDIDIARTS